MLYIFVVGLVREVYGKRFVYGIERVMVTKGGGEGFG